MSPNPHILRSPVDFRIIGLVLVLLAVAITLFDKCPTDVQYLSIYILIGLGISLVLAKSVEQSSFSYKISDFGIKLGGGVAFIFILLWVNPVRQFKSGTPCMLPHAHVTVFVHGKKGLQDLILKGKGAVMMDIQGERKEEPIGELGEAKFSNLVPGDGVRLDIDFSEPYKAVFPDSVYRIEDNENIYLLVSLQGVDVVKGKVIYDDEALSGVSVSIDGMHTLTDSLGNYDLAIPDSLQKNEYTVWFSKNGYKTVSFTAYPETGKGLDITMQKK